jgi:mRNA-degrading endonuclease toxin of MazEF toxin-antitoxin module
VNFLRQSSVRRSGAKRSWSGAAGLVAGLAVVVVLLPLTSVPLASASSPVCDPSTVTVTAMHSPDGTTRPMYVDLAHGATLGSGYVGYELTGASGALGNDVWVQLSGFGGVVGLAANQSAAIPARTTSQAGHPLVYAYLTAGGISASAQSWTVEVWNGKPGQSGSSEVCTQSDGFSTVENVISANSNKITSISVSTTQPAIGGSFQVTAVGDTGTMGAGLSSDQSGGNGVFSMAPAMDNSWPADTFTLTGVQVTMGGSTLRDKLRVYPSTSSEGAYTAVYSFTVRGSAASSTAILPVQNIASGAQVKYTGSYPATTAIPAPVQTASLVKSASNFSSGDLTYQVVVSNSSAGSVTLDYVQDTPTPTSGWSFKTGSAKLDGAPIPDPTNSSGLLIFGGPFTVPAASGTTAGTVTLLYALHLTATVTNSVVGSVGGQTLAAPSGTQNEVTVDPSAPIITTASLPDAMNGTAYSQTLAASSGTLPYTWSITVGSLPAGLSLTASTGRISGTPTVNGTSTFTVRVTDSAGTPKSASKSVSITVGDVVADTTPPNGGIGINGGASATNTATISLALSATDAIGVTAYRAAEGSDCSSASWFAVTSTTSYSSTASLGLSSGNGTKTVCAQYKDAAGNVSTTATSTITLDTVAPTVALSTGAANPTNAAFTVTATFAEPVSGFSLADVLVGNGSTAGLSGSGSAYTFTVTPVADGTVTVDIPAGVAVDGAGNTNSAAAQLSRSYDATPPSVVLSSTAANPTNAAFTVTATFSEPVTGFSLTAVTVGNATKSSLSGSGSTYTFTVTPAGDGTVTVDVPAGGAADTTGNTNTAAPQLTRTFDTARPSVALSTLSANPTNTAFAVVVTFSKSVTGFSLADVSVGNGSTSGLSGSGVAYTFTVTPTGDGAVTVDVPAGVAVDGAANTNSAAAQLSRSYDGTRPSVVLSSAAANPTNAAFTVTATFSEPVTGFSLADVSVGNGSTSGLSGSGAAYTFTVTPVAQGTVTVDVPAGVAVDSAGNTNTAAAQLARSYDASRPGVVLSTSAKDPTSAGSFTVSASFTKPVTGLDLGVVTVENGTASNLQGSGQIYTFVVIPAADGVVTVDLAAGRASDGTGNTNTAAARLSLTSDRTPPLIAFTSAPAPITAATSATFSFAADDPEAVLACSVDGHDFGDCTSPVSLFALAAGNHLFEVQATDAAGNSSTASRSWTVASGPALKSVVAGKGGPDVKVEIKASTTDIVAGKQFKTTATATNVGSASAEDVTLKIDLPPNTEFVSGEAFRTDGPNAWLKFNELALRTLASATGFPCSVSQSVVSCPVGRLDPGAQFIVNLNLRGLRAGTLDMRADTKSSNAVAANAALRLNARPATVEITVDLKTSRSFETVSKDEIFGATGIVANVGGTRADDVFVKLMLPRGASFVSESTHRCKLHGRALACPIGTLEPNARFLILVRLRALRSGRIAVVAVGSTRNQRNVRSRLVLHAPGGRVCTIYGTTRVVRGTQGDDVICLSPGFHLVYALAGNDVVYGRTGTQVVYGGRGNDLLIGSAGDDYLDGGPGKDELRGGSGNDKLVGRAGNDLLLGGSGKDRLHGGTGRDREVWHRGDVVFEVARGPVREWHKQWLSSDVPLITHLLTHI